MFLMTLGYGLFINLDASSSWAKIILYQIIGGLGIGPIFQAPIIALQAHIKPRDIGTATATLGFIRQLATSTSIVIGQVVFQNQMEMKSNQLERIVGPQLAERLGGGSAGANTQVIAALPPNQRGPIRILFANSLQPMWIMYTCFAAVGLAVSFLIKKKVLTSDHTETKTGMEAERANAAERKAEKTAKRDLRASRQLGASGTPQSPSPVADEKLEKS